MDLKIAFIALVHHATLLLRNIQDFQQVADLQVENWLQ
jgi:predicted nucleic acid-binding protein